MTRHTIEWGLWVDAGEVHGDGSSLKDWPRRARKAQQRAMEQGLARFPGARVLEDHVEARRTSDGRAGLYRCMTLEVAP